MRSQLNPEVMQEREGDMEILIGYILLIGVLLSLVLVASGIIWYWARTGNSRMSYQIPRGDFFRFLIYDFRQLFWGTFRPRLLVNLGIAALLLTPYIRVFASIIFFAVEERNWKYTIFTGIVFSILTYSLFLR